jgi:hypothetical protein
MDVRIAVLADYASLSQGNKLNILGVFTNVHAGNVPVLHPQMVLVLMLEFNSSEAGSKKIKIELVDEDGGEIFSITGELSVNRESDGRATLINQILNLNGIVFPRFGDYEFRVLIDSDTKSIIPLKVIQTPPQQLPDS